MGRRNFLFIPAVTYAGYTSTANTKLLYYLRTNSTDYSGNGNTGTDTSISYSNNMASFDGTGSYITKAANSTLDFGLGDLTISSWVITNDISTYRWICSKRHSTPGWGTGFDHGIGYSYTYSDGGGTPGITGTISLTTGICYNIITTWSSTNGSNVPRTLKSYVDGVSTGPSTIDGYSTFNDTSDFRVGSFGYPVKTAELWKGKIGELIVENTVWDQTKITNYYNSSKTYYKGRI